MLLDILLGASHLTPILITTWCAVALACCVSWLVAVERFRSRLKAAAATSGDPLVDVIRLEQSGPLAHAKRLVRRLERPSLLLPLISASLLAPLSLHLLVASLFLGTPAEHFNSWILISLVLVGHAHAALVVFCVRHVGAVTTALDQGHQAPGFTRGALALLWTVSISTIPGALLLFVPPVLVGTTGAFFVPAMFHWAAWRARSERRALSALD